MVCNNLNTILHNRNYKQKYRKITERFQNNRKVTQIGEKINEIQSDSRLSAQRNSVRQQIVREGFEFGCLFGFE